MTLSNASPKILCSSDLIQKQLRSHKLVFRSARQTVSTQYQDEAVFKIFDYNSFTFSNITFTARYITNLQSGSDLVLWVKGKKSPTVSEVSLSDWHTAEPNLLNSTKVNNSSSLSSLQSDRYNVLSKLAKTLKFEIIPKMEKVTSPISDHQNARFRGVHILLYDIKDSFDQDEAFFGGYLDPVDQESAPNGPINLVHMDIYPMTPGGRPSPAKVTQKDFYHTITHELFHLYHYRKSKELGVSWGSIHNWLKEGLAQLAVYEFLQDGVFYDTSTKLLDTTIEYVSQLPSYFELKTPISIFDNIFENYGLSYIWYSHLLNNKVGDERVKLFTDLTQKTDCAVVHTQLCTNGLSKTLLDNGLDLNDELAKFAIAQYYNHEGLKLSSLSKSAYTSLAKLRTQSSTLVSNMTFLEFEPVKNYQITYQPVINDTEQYKSIEFSASVSFVLVKYPSSSTIETCVSSDDFASCFLSLGTDHLIFEGKNKVLNILPSEELNLIYFFVGHPNGDRDKHFVSARVLQSHNFESEPFFQSRPKLKFVSNSLQIDFKANNSNLSLFKPKLILKSQKKSNNAEFFIKPADLREIYSDNGQTELSLYLDGYISSLNGKKIRLVFRNSDGLEKGESFQFLFSSTYPLQTETYSVSIYEGWNSLAVYPTKNNQTISEYLDLSIQNLNPQDCVYSYVNFEFHSLRDNIINCSVPTSSMSTELLSPGLGLYIKSNIYKELVSTRLQQARSKIQLQKGWNFKSLSFHNKNKAFNQSGEIAVSYGYNGKNNRWDRVYNFGENPPNYNGLDIGILDFSRSFFIYSLSEHILYSY
ncbi:MAG: hypothetical protein KC646_17040 [Candidatus Cloacimonetes bacterium]|nr:hypothetical protein [Candidatus Cloacimonadota bacterium]